MKTYGFNLLPQKSRSLIKKEDKRDNYSIAVAILPFLSVVVWLLIILFNSLILETNISSWEAAVQVANEEINVDLAPILIKHGEMVMKTNALAGVVTNDINPERLFILLDEIYQEDPTFSITGYGRNAEGSFFVSIIAISNQRLAEVARRFKEYRFIEDVGLTSVSLDPETNSASGSITFLFNYFESEITEENDSE